MNEDNSLHALLQPGEADNFFEVNDLPDFDPTATSAYSRGNALWLMEISRLVYRKDKASRQNFFSQRAKLDEVKFFGNEGAEEFADSGAQGALVKSQTGKFAVLAFRGTLGPVDVRTDLNFPLGDWKGTNGKKGEGKVHQGFKSQLEAVWTDVTTELASLEEARIPVFYTGHSLGAALATLAAARRVLEGRTPPAAVYSFGSPRVGTSDFSRAFPESLLHCRVVNDRDIVPTLPPRRLSLFGSRPNYHHVGTSHRIEHRDNVIRSGKLNDDEGATSFFAELLTSLRSVGDNFTEILRTGNGNLFERFTDHTPVNYTARLERARLQ